MTREDLALRRAQGAQQAMDLYNVVSLNEGKRRIRLQRY